MACGIAAGLLTAYERCVCKATLPTAQKLADFYKVPLATILTAESMSGLVAVHNQIGDVLGITAEADQ